MAVNQALPSVFGLSEARWHERQAEAYGERMPLSALATTLVRDPQLLVVNVFDPSVRSTCRIDSCLLFFAPCTLQTVSWPVVLSASVNNMQ